MNVINFIEVSLVYCQYTIIKRHVCICKLNEATIASLLSLHIWFACGDLALLTASLYLGSSCPALTARHLRRPSSSISDTLAVESTRWIVNNAYTRDATHYTLSSSPYYIDESATIRKTGWYIHSCKLFWYHEKSVYTAMCSWLIKWEK